MNPTYSHRATICPGCKQIINASSDPKARGAPRPRDVTICIGCGTILQFEGNLRLRSMTPEQLEHLPQETLEELREHQERWRAHRGRPLSKVVMP